MTVGQVNRWTSSYYLLAVGSLLIWPWPCATTSTPVPPISRYCSGGSPGALVTLHYRPHYVFLPPFAHDSLTTHSLTVMCLTCHRSVSHHDMDSALHRIRHEVYSTHRLSLSVNATLLPCLKETRSYVYPGEYVYFDKSPEYLLKNLVIYRDDPTR